MQVKKITPQGYCKGVINALKIVNEAINNKELPRPIYLLGNVIHNKIVMERIIEKGVIVINNKATRLEMLEEINSGTVIFSAHGVSPKVYQKAQTKGLHIIDASCPYVKLVHKKIIDNLESSDIIYIGTKGHSEAEGVLGISNKIHFISSLDEINNLSIENKNIYVTNQTTLSSLDLKNIFDKILLKYPSAIIDNKICMATTLRQEAVINQEKSDLCLVVGDVTSSNSKKLELVSEKYAGIKSVLVESIEDVKKLDLSNISSINITSGASTPSDVVDEIIEYLKEK